MTTRMYMSDAASPYNPTTFKGAWDTAASSANGKLTLNRLDSGGGLNVKTRTAPNTNAYAECMARFVSLPLLAGTLAPATVDIGFLIDENDAGLNAVLHVHVWVTQGDSDTVRGTLITDITDTQEFAVSSPSGKQLASPPTSTSVTVVAGDRIVVEMGYKLVSPTVTNSVDFWYAGGGTDIVIGNGTGGNHSPWIDLPTIPTAYKKANHARILG